MHGVQVHEGSGRLAGRVAMITGGASGMGLATVRRFLAEGARVVMADLNDAAGASVLDELSTLGHGDDVRFTRTDVAGAALFLASDDARFVTGDALVVDGGLTAAGPSLVTRLTVDPGQVGLVGVNRGTTGQAPTVRNQR